MTAWLRDKMVNQQFNIEMEFGPRDVLGAIVAVARERPRQIVLEDASRQPLSYRRLLAAADGPGPTAAISPLTRRQSRRYSPAQRQRPSRDPAQFVGTSAKSPLF